MHSNLIPFNLIWQLFNSNALLDINYTRLWDASVLRLVYHLLIMQWRIERPNDIRTALTFAHLNPLKEVWHHDRHSKFEKGDI